MTHWLLVGIRLGAGGAEPRRAGVESAPIEVSRPTYGTKLVCCSRATTIAARPALITAWQSLVAYSKGRPYVDFYAA